MSNVRPLHDLEAKATKVAALNLFRKVTATALALLAGVVIISILPMILLFLLLARLSEVVMP